MTIGRGQVQGASSTTLNFQARILSGSGALVPDGNYHVEFKLYDLVSGGSALWTETRTTGNLVTVKNGYLSAYLGSVNSFPTTIDWNEEHWLTMNIGGSAGSPTWDGEMAPRIKLTAVPYAFQAGQLAKTSGANRGVLGFYTVANNPNIELPDESGTVCLQTASSCGFLTGSGDAFIQGGNDFNATAVLGTTDADALNLITNGATRLGISSGGSATLTGGTTGVALTVNNSTSTSHILNLQNNGVNVASVDNTGRLQLISNGFNPSGISQSIIQVGNTITKDFNQDSVYVLNFDSTINVDVDPGAFGGDVFFRNASNRVIDTDITDTGGQITFLSDQRVTAGGNFDTDITGAMTGLQTDLSVAATGSSTMTIGTVYGARLAASGIGTGITVTNRYGLRVEDAIGTGTVNTQYGVHIKDMTKGGANYGIYVEGATNGHAVWVDSGSTRLDGTLQVGTLGATDTSTLLCHNTANQLAACSTTANGAAFVQGGNNFGVSTTGVLGLTSNNDLNVITNNLTRLTVQADGDVAFDGTVLFVDAVGDRVGVGAAPSTKLHIKQSAQGVTQGLRIEDSSGTNAINIFTDFGGNGLINFDDSYHIGHFAAGIESGQLAAGRLLTIKSFNNSTLGGIAFDLNGVELGRFHSNGNFGVGDATPDNKFDIDAVFAPATTGTTTNTASGLTVTNSVSKTAGTDTTYGQQISVSRTGASTGSTINTYGLDIQATGNTAGTSTVTGLNINVSGADANYAAIFQGGSVGIGTQTPDGRLELAGNMSQAAWGLNGIQLQSAAATYTDTDTAGTRTNTVINSFGRPTLASTNAVNSTNAATLYIENSPLASGNHGITNAYSLWVDDGVSRFDGNVIVNGMVAASNDSVVCLSGSNQLAACNSTFATTANAFLQGGNTFSGTTAGVLGTVNNGNLNFITNNVTRLTIDTSGNASLTGNLTVGGDIFGGTTQGDTLGLRGSNQAWSTTTPNYVDITSSRLRFTGQTSVAQGDVSSLIYYGETVNYSGVSIGGLAGFTYAPTVQYNTSQVLSTFPAFYANAEYQVTAAGVNDGTFNLFGGYLSVPVFSINHSGGSGVSDGFYGYVSSPRFEREAGQTGTHTTANATNYVANHGLLGVVSVGAGNTVTNWRGFHNKNATTSGGGVITNQYGLHVDDLTTGTNDYGVVIEGADTYALWSKRGAVRMATTSSADAFQLQNGVSANLLSVDASQTGNVGVNTGAEVNITGWIAHGTATIARTTTAGEFASGVGGIRAVITAQANAGVRNNLGAALTVSSAYTVSFSVRASTSLSDLTVAYYRNSTTLDTTCTDYSAQTADNTGFKKVTCNIDTTATAGNTTAQIAIYQVASATRNIFIDNFSVMRITSTSTTATLRVGGSSSQGLTLLTLDSYGDRPWSSNINTLYGSMYYDTTLGKIQCYEADGWGACGGAPDNIVNLVPEYAGSVLNGTGVGTMTADLCSGTSFLSINTSLCGASESRNFYKWTTPQVSSQTYSIYISYQLPSTFNGFADASTVKLTGRTSSTSGGNGVTFALYQANGTQCGTTTTVNTVIDTWETTSLSGDETACAFAANDVITFRINMTASSSSNAFSSNFSFTTLGK